MTFFDPKYYCKQNLKEEDRKTLDACRDLFLEVIERARDTYEDEYCTESVDRLKLEVVDSFVEIVKEDLGVTLQEETVGLIESYEEDVAPVEDPETYEDDNDRTETK